MGKRTKVKQKVIVLVRGGLVQGAWGPDGTEIEVMDFDDAEEEGTESQLETELESQIKKLGLKAIY